jgi:uncharacterized damage-inducible protein DinB
MEVNSETEVLRFPIGRFKFPENYRKADLEEWIGVIETLPDRLADAVVHLDDSQLDTPYREGGWTIRQVVHHLADSHMNSYCRFKLALTEDSPVIRAYQEDRWAEQSDGRSAPPELSLQLLDALHARWAYFMSRMTEKDWERPFIHPESKREFPLKAVLALYAWHSEHHLQHVIRCKERNGWD